MASPEISPIAVRFTVDTSGLKKAEQAIADSGDQMQSKVKGLGKVAAGAIAAVGTVVAVRGIANFTSEAIKGAEAAQVANDRIEQIAKSMNLFGSETDNVTKRLTSFADQNELLVAVDADVIKATQAKLLTFKELAGSADVANGAFDRATLAAIDLAAAGFGSAETNAVQLGKALQDPVKGLAALGRSGVTFTEIEKAKIEALVESGKVLEAQDLVLKAIETQVGGTAKATASSTDIMKLGFAQVKDAVGDALLPSFQELASTFASEAPKIASQLTPVLAELGEKFRTDILPAILKLIPVVSALLLLLADNFEIVLAVVGAISGLAAVVKTFTLIQAALNLVLAANPIGLIIIAVAALVAGIVYLATQTTFFQDAWNAMTALVTTAWQKVVTFFTTAGTTIQNVFRTIGDTVKNIWNGVITFIGDLVNSIGEKIRGFFNGVVTFVKGLGTNLYNIGKSIWQSFVNGALDALFALPKLAGDIISKVPGLGGVGNAITSGINNIKSGVSNTLGAGRTTASPTVVNNYNQNISAKGLTVNQVQKDAQRRGTLMRPVGVKR